MTQTKSLFFSLIQLMTQVAWWKYELTQIWLKDYISKNELTQPDSNVMLSQLKIDSNVKMLLSRWGRAREKKIRHDSERRRGSVGVVINITFDRGTYMLVMPYWKKNNINDKNVCKNTNESLFLCGNKWQFNFWTSYHSFSSRYDLDSLCSLYQDRGSQAHQATFLPVP